MVDIRTGGDHAHRKTTIKDAQSDLGSGSMTAACLEACTHASTDVRQKRKALKYLETHVPGKHARHVAELLHTPQVPIAYGAEVKVGVEEHE